MKYFFVAVLFNSVLFPSLSAQYRGDFTVTGTISGKETGKLYLRYYYNNQKVIDSSQIKNGTFLFKGSLNEPVKAELCDDKKLFKESYENYVSDFYIEPSDMEISLVNKQFAKARLKGSRTEDEYKLLYHKLNPLSENIFRLQSEMKLSNEKNVFLKDSLVMYNNKFSEISIDFINTHNNSFISLKAIQGLSAYEEMEPDSCLLLIKSLSAEVNNYQATQKSKEAFIAESTSLIGHIPRDFTRQDASGKTIKLSLFRGKYVLLDFWASWCTPCRELTPHIKELYRQYASQGLEVIAISCDTKYEAWRTAMKIDNTGSFVNILSFTEKDMNFLKTHDKASDASYDGELRKHFNLMPIPVSILIDKEGVILGRYGATEKQTFEMLDKKLEEIFTSTATSDNKRGHTNKRVIL